MDAFEPYSISHRSPSVGSLIKKMIDVNPDLTTHELIAMVRQTICTRERPNGDFGTIETVDEPAALALARASLAPRGPA